MIYAIGDIHGQYDKLRRLLRRLDEAGLCPEDRLVFVGDYVDRGPETARVLDFLCQYKLDRPNTVFLRGNHEQMMLDARERFDPSFNGGNPCHNNESGKFWFVEGGLQTMKSYGTPKRPNWLEYLTSPVKSKVKRWFDIVSAEHWRFLTSTDLEFSQGSYTFVHAGIVPPGKEWKMDNFDADPRLWIRYEFIGSLSDFGGQTVIFGHTPTRDGRPMILPNKVAIDTGAGFGGPLTGVRLPEPYDPAKVEVFQG